MIGNLYKRLITSFVGGVIFFGSYLFCIKAFVVLLAAILVEILIFEWPRLVSTFSVVSKVILTGLIPVGSFGLLTYLMVCSSHGLYPIMIGWTHDSCSYVAGKLFGVHKLCPGISPGKTWEGLLGGLFGVFIVHALVFGRSIFLPLSICQIFIVTLLALFGDLFISWIKRRANVKDAGSILPGHGGFIDRFDSILFLVYWVALVGVHFPVA